MNIAFPFPVYETLVWHLPRATKSKEGRKEGGKEGRKGGRKEGGKEARKEVRKKRSKL